MTIINELVKLANHLDNKGFTKEADRVDSVLRRLFSAEKCSECGKPAEGYNYMGEKKTPVCLAHGECYNCGEKAQSPTQNGKFACGYCHNID